MPQRRPEAGAAVGQVASKPPPVLQTGVHVNQQFSGRVRDQPSIIVASDTISGGKLAFHTAASRSMNAMQRIVTLFGHIACFILLPLQILIALFFIVGRQFLDIPATALQELEWQLFTACVFLLIGLAYLHDRHVRIDIFREKFSRRTRAWIELAGFFVAILPVSVLFIWQGSMETWTAFVWHEHSRATLGLGYKWIIKATVPLGATFLLLAGMVVFNRNLKFLRNGT
jgi:TRAP-type mannitol/chloroaromatic compound transport system permease small subunit